MESCVDSLSQKIEKLSTWCTYNRLQVNWDKTFMMPVCEKRVFKQYNFSLSYILGKTTITMVHKFKLLGVRSWQMSRKRVRRLGLLYSA
jgi:hypothetical protein